MRSTLNWDLLTFQLSVTVIILYSSTYPSFMTSTRLKQGRIILYRKLMLVAKLYTRYKNLLMNEFRPNFAFHFFLHKDPKIECSARPGLFEISANAQKKKKMIQENKVQFVCLCLE